MRLFALIAGTTTVLGCSTKNGPLWSPGPGQTSAPGSASTPVPFAPGANPAAVPAGGTGTSTPAGGGIVAAPTGGGTGTTISSGTVTTVPNATVTSSGLPASTAGKTTYVGPEPGFALVVRNPYDTRAWDLRITVQGMSREQVLTAVFGAIQNNQSSQASVTLNGTIISGLDVQYGGSPNNWYLTGQQGTSMARGSGNITYTAATLPVNSQINVAITGVLGGQLALVAWLLDQGTTSGNISAGQSWWNGDTSNPLATIKLWVNAAGALTSFSNTATGRLEPYRLLGIDDSKPRARSYPH